MTANDTDSAGIKGVVNPSSKESQLFGTLAESKADMVERIYKYLL